MQRCRMVTVKTRLKYIGIETRSGIAFRYGILLPKVIKGSCKYSAAFSEAQLVAQE